jgi:beta-glucosidase
MGGLAWRGSVDHLLKYGETLFRALGDRVKKWITINEPVVYAFYGYGLGLHAPGRARDLRGVFHSTHHMLLAHARLLEACNSLVAGGSAGIANHCDWISPREPSTRRDRDAALFMEEAELGLYNDPIFLGEYPPRVLRRLGRFFPKGFERDLERMKQPQGFLGLNYYSRNRYRYAPLAPYLRAKEVVDPRAPRSAVWEIYPGGIRALLRRVREKYGNPPCYITENGYPLPEAPGRDPLEDPERIAYIADHAAMVGKAIEEGADCRGYFYWSLMDNFEWSNGNALRFGLLRTDFESQRRQWRKSAFWYRDLIADNRLAVERLPAD